MDNVNSILERIEAKANKQEEIINRPIITIKKRGIPVGEDHNIPSQFLISKDMMGMVGAQIVRSSFPVERNGKQIIKHNYGKNRIAVFPDDNLGLVMIFTDDVEIAGSKTIKLNLNGVANDIKATNYWNDIIDYFGEEELSAADWKLIAGNIVSDEATTILQLKTPNIEERRLTKLVETISDNVASVYSEEDQVLLDNFNEVPEEVERLGDDLNYIRPVDVEVQAENPDIPNYSFVSDPIDREE